ncbi:related to acetyltransferase [Cephalotrichum gorgonifer]|uniref:Related to acetyltransferase n=1 Tax=Cephalotrichum gorgonifer TaxID=2041049 RepID=A0AAE8MTB2_9PEZI|nr:related to acetyltransferase [Cephalotrichum gorgonifer]
METELKHRTAANLGGTAAPATDAPPIAKVDTIAPEPKVPPTAGKLKHGLAMQIFRRVSLALYFILSCVAIVLTQLIGAPLYWYDRNLYYSYMALTKESFGILAVTVTHWWGSTVMRISGDESVAGQIRKTADGRVEFDFPERLVLIANHQIYTDWLYLWWAGYANRPQMHGHLYIILKESLKFIPVLGQGMLFYGFIFMSRKMAVDQPRLAYRLQKLRQEHTALDGSKYLDPMWLLLFPEGTNLSRNNRVKSAKWAEKSGVKDMEHALLPRSTGSLFCLRELKGSVEYLYDCTVAYEGVPYSEECYTLSGIYFEGRPPKSVNFYWRRFRIDDIPLDDADEFDEWLRQRWYEKDELLDGYLSTGKFPPTPTKVEGDAKTEDATGDGYVVTDVRTKSAGEFTRIYVVLGSVFLVWRILARVWGRFTG